MTTPLMNAMSLRSFSITKQLLDAKADANLTVKGRDSCFMAATFARCTNIEAWLDYFGGSWDVNRREDAFGAAALAGLASFTSDAADADATLKVPRDSVYSMYSMCVRMYAHMCIGTSASRYKGT